MANTVKTAFLLGVLSAIFLFFGEMFGGAQGVGVAFVFALITNIGSYWFWKVHFFIRTSAGNKK